MARVYFQCVWVYIIVGSPLQLISINRAAGPPALGLDEVAFLGGEILQQVSSRAKHCMFHEEKLKFGHKTSDEKTPCHAFSDCIYIYIITIAAFMNLGNMAIPGNCPPKTSLIVCG